MKIKNRTTISALRWLLCIVVTVPLLAGVPIMAAAGEDSGTVAAGLGPEDALPPSGGWRPMSPGESRWYAFEYAGDGSQIEVFLQTEPSDAATLAVWTPDGVRRRGLGLEADPIGRGSADPSAPGGLLWSGNFQIPGTYYAVVQHAGDHQWTSFYQLEIRGDGVSLSKPDPAATPTPQAAKTKTKKPAPGKPKGKLVFQTTIGGDFYTINADGSGLQRISDGVDPVWSPDGSQIAFARWRQPRGVWVVDASGSGERRLFDWNETRWPSWSPDGTEILFSRQHGGRTEEAERCFWGFCFDIPAKPHWKAGIVQPADGAFYEPSAPNIVLAPTWSPGGDRFVYDGEQGLTIQTLDGEVSYQITDDGRDTGPAWSPDGGKVVFTRRQHDHWEVYVVDADGRNLSRLTDTPIKPDGEVGNSAAAAWSPDGQYLAFLTDRTGKWELWIMKAGGGGQKPFFKDALKGLPLEYASVSERAISWTE